MADDVVVVGCHVTKFTRISRLTVVEFTVDDNSDSQAPTDVDEDYIFQSFTTSFAEFCESHASSIILYANWKLD